MAHARRDGRLDRRSRRAREERRDPRACLLAAAEGVLIRRGYAAATVAAIAAEAGFSKGAMYRHFASKEELLLALLEERVDGRIRAILDATAAAPAEEDMAPRASEHLLDLFHEEREMLLLWHELWSVAVRDPRLRERYVARDRALRNALAGSLEARAATRGAPRFAMPAEHAATAFIALAEGLSQARLIDPDAVPDHLYGEVLSLVYEGLVARSQR